MIVHVAVEEPVMPDWIYKKGHSDQRLLEFWHGRADIRTYIRSSEYLPAPTPWKVQYRSVNCSGHSYALH